MASQPLQIYFDRAAGILRTAGGAGIFNEMLFPSAILSQKRMVNLQVVTDAAMTAYAGYDAGCSANIIVDNDYINHAPLIDLEAGDGNWTQVGETNEYYYAETEDLSAEPASVWVGDVEATAGTVTSLAVGEWGWDGDKLYLRMGDDSDPDGQVDGYIQFKPDVTATKPFIEVDGGTVQAVGSWYAAGFRNPDITAGEISFDITAKTAQFYNRLGTDEKKVCVMQIQLLEVETSELLEILAFNFVCQNRFLPSGAKLEVEITNYYTKAEADTRYLQLSQSGDITITDSGHGFVMRKPNGDYARLTIDNDNIPSITDI